jgi:putative membrane protein
LIDLLLIILIALLGAVVGCGTGIVVGLHINNLSLLLLSISGVFCSLLAPLEAVAGIDNFTALLLAILLIAAATAHTFVNIVPTTFLGAPNEDSALLALPSHSLLLKGRGHEAVCLSALGSLGSVFFCFALFLPFRFLIGEPGDLYELIMDIMPFLLIAISFILIGTEHGEPFKEKFGKNSSSSRLSGIGFAALVYFLSGFFGLVIFKMQVQSPIGLPAPVLFPALSGLFGCSALIYSLKHEPSLPPQSVAGAYSIGLSKSLRSIFTGTLSGTLVSILPGVTPAAGTIIAQVLQKEKDERAALISISAVNTANSFFVLLMLFMFLKLRSGVALALDKILIISSWDALLMPASFAYLMIGLLVAALVSYFLTCWIGKVFALKISNIAYKKVVIGAICGLGGMVCLFTGLKGLVVFLTGTSIGLTPIIFGVRRSQSMGVLLVPLILSLLLN